MSPETRFYPKVTGQRAVLNISLDTFKPLEAQGIQRVCAPHDCLNVGRCDEIDQSVDRPGVADGERSVANVGKMMPLGSFAAPIPSFNYQGRERHT